MDDEDLAALDGAAQSLLYAFDAVGVMALVIYRVDNQLVVRCQESGDVLWACERVVEQFATPSGRTVN